MSAPTDCQELTFRMRITARPVPPEPLKDCPVALMIIGPISTRVKRATEEVNEDGSIIYSAKFIHSIHGAMPQTMLGWLWGSAFVPIVAIDQ